MIDIFIGATALQPRNLCTVFELSSDHFLVMADIGNKQVRTRFLKVTDWRNYNLLTSEQSIIADIRNTEELESAAALFTLKIQKALEHATGVKDLNVFNRWNLSQDERDLVRRKHLAKKNWQSWRREKETCQEW